MLARFFSRTFIRPKMAQKFHAVANNLLEPCLRVGIVSMFEDNYGYLVIDEANQTMFAIDPAEPSTMIPAIEAESGSYAREIVAVLTTHKHRDHAGGNDDILAKYKGIKVYGPSREDIPAMTNPLSGGEVFTIGAVQVEALFTPCHTAGHISYLVRGDPDTPPLLFPGDTLFIGGCGKFFEGTAQDMYHSLYDVIMKLPLETKIYCGHEYTMSNLRFAQTIDPTNKVLNAKIKWVKDRRARGLPTVPSTLEEEMEFNPFLRVHSQQIKESVGGNNPVETLGLLRSRKDTFTFTT